MLQITKQIIELPIPKYIKQSHSIAYRDKLKKVKNVINALNLHKNKDIIMFGNRAQICTPQLKNLTLKRQITKQHSLAYNTNITSTFKPEVIFN